MTHIESFRIGRWTACPARNRLQRGRRSVSLEPIVMDVLAALAASGTETLSRRQILDRVWPGVHVVDGVLARAIYQLRKALGEDAGIVETVRRRGYRLTQAVQPVNSAIRPQQPRARLRELAAFAAVLIACLLALSTSPLAGRPETPAERLVASAVIAQPVETASAGPDLVPVMSLADERARNIAANREALRREREAVRPSWDGHLTHAGTPQPDPAPEPGRE